jgi:hypothetical protein
MMRQGMIASEKYYDNETGSVADDKQEGDASGITTNMLMR